jgi:hypothetical protein
MRLIERLHDYLIFSHISAYAFEHSCGVSNGYLGKQLKGRGSVGSDILEKIKENYPDLSLIWLVTGKGSMLVSLPDTHSGSKNRLSQLNEEQQLYYTSKDELITLLNRQLLQMEKLLEEKNRMIEILEDTIQNRGLFHHRKQQK